jgi:alkylresorcinol/alkylpyrone synthase
VSLIASVCPVLPDHRYPQQQITEAFADLCLGEADRRRLLSRLHASARVEHRHTALALPDYAALTDFTAANDAYLKVAVELGTRACAGAIAAAGLAPEDVDLICSTTVTGIGVPSIEARMMPRIGLREDVVRLPIYGLGCAGGVAGVARTHDYLTAHPDRVAVLVSVELCTLTLQRDDPSTANMVASGLFGDGAAAVVMVGDERAAEFLANPRRPTGPTGPWVRDSYSCLYADSERAMGWDVGSAGLKIVLGVEVPELVEKNLARTVDDFLHQAGVSRDAITSWVSHPGGPKVLQAVEAALDLPDDALAVTWESLARVGNLSSASVLHVLHDTIAGRRPAAGSRGLMVAMGPGFASELALLDW